ncbi:MAG: M20/M25/M40 family metallo-hydrolase [Acidobacteriota bacterium]
MRMRTLAAVHGALLWALSLPASSPRDLAEAVRPVRTAGAYETVARLSSPEYAGRLTGTEGFERAGRWVAAEAAGAGLKAPAEFPDHLQPYPVLRVSMRAASMELIPADGQGEPRALTMFKDFMPILTSSAGEVTSEVVFAGFGITAPELGRDDYAGLDVKGRIVVVLRGEPKDGRDWSAYNDSHARYANAASHGAAACLLADQAVASPNGEPLTGTLTGEISTAFADELLAEKGLKCDDLRKALEAGGAVSFPTGRRLRYSVDAGPPVLSTGFNVLAVLPGSDPGLRGECVVLGAHLDHCGDWPRLLPGADDNASGSAALLEAARAAARLRPRPARSLVFAWFGGEEMGLLGSKHLAAHFPASLGRPVAVLNLDMVGAGNGAWVAAGQNHPAIYAALETARDRVEPTFQLKAGLSRGEARADHGPFLKAGIPAVSLFGMGGKHVGYHTPEDTVYFITPRTIEASARVALAAAILLADAPPGPG